VLVIGPGTIGLLAALFLRARGAEVHLLGRGERSRAFAKEFGFEHTWQRSDLPDLRFDAVIDASNGADSPGFALSRVEPGGRIVGIGLATEPTPLDTRDLVIGDVTVVGILSGSPGLSPTIAAYTEGSVDPRGLVAATVGLDEVGAVLAGRRPAGAGPGPKIHVDPRL
jgi:threonine dehydrogenase-like Zn-dependent dehydrogenase